MSAIDGFVIESKPVAHFGVIDRLPGAIGDALAVTPVIATVTDGCEIVFADPDNGIRSTGHMAPYRTKAVKYAYLDELAAFAAQGLSLVVYHHADRSASV